jgi:Bacterial regulatory proteins, tetR family
MSPCPPSQPASGDFIPDDVMQAGLCDLRQSTVKAALSAVAEDREVSPQRGRPRDANVENAILNAAVAILNEVGYNDLSIEAVASRARVGRPTVYRRWPSKLDLVVDAVVRLVPAVSAPDTGDVFTDLEELISETSRT